MKAVRYTRHARNRMRLHKISEEEIELAINKPDFIEVSSEGRFNAWMKISEKYLRVTFKQEAERILIITAVKQRKGWR
jgi:hypothetical protein